MSVKAYVVLGFIMLFGSCNNEGKTSSEVKEDSMKSETVNKDDP